MRCRPGLALQPPDSLSPGARRVWLDLVANHEPEHFEPGDVTLLEQYCEASALATAAAARLHAGGDTNSLRTWERATAVMASLSLRLRLGPQARREKARAGKPMTWSDSFALSQDGR
jgi:phage terminase small subunit